MTCCIFIAALCLVSVTSSQETMTCSRTSDTFQLPSAFPSTVTPATVRIGKQGPKGDKGVRGSKGSKGEAPPLREFREQIEGIQLDIASNNNISEKLLNQLSILRQSLLATPESGWFNGLNGFQYKVTPNAQDWEESRRVCQSMGGDLAAEGFRDVVRKAIHHGLSINYRAWIGLSDNEEEGSFKWVDGVESTPENTAWFTSNNEPNGGASENCVEIYVVARNNQFNDRSCSSTNRAICAKELTL